MPLFEDTDTAWKKACDDKAANVATDYPAKVMKKFGTDRDFNRRVVDDILASKPELSEFRLKMIDYIAPKVERYYTEYVDGEITKSRDELLNLSEID